MNHDATLGIRLTDLCRAQEQSPVRVNPETWARYPAIAGLGAIPQEIRRTDLAERAGRISWDAPHHDEVARLFVLTMAWGSGVTNGRGPRYTGAALAAGASTIDTLVHTRALIAEGDVAGAYRLHRRLPGVRPLNGLVCSWCCRVMRAKATLSDSTSSNDGSSSHGTSGSGSVLPSR